MLPVDTHFALSKVIPITFEHLATHYQTLETFMGYNATHYLNLNALPNMLPHALPQDFSEICLVLGNLQRVTTRYRQFYEKYIYTIFKKNLTVTRGNQLQIAQNQANLREMYGKARSNASGNLFKSW